MKQSELFKFACQCLLLDEHPGLKEGIKEKFISGEVDLDRFGIPQDKQHKIKYGVISQIKKHFRIFGTWIKIKS